MAFPMSGSSYVFELLHQVSQTSGGTNYGDEQLDISATSNTSYESTPLRPEMVNGPFTLKPDLPLTENGYVLTKTHCGGYCFSDCPPSWYRLSPLKFLQECRLGTRYEFEEFGKAPKQTWVQYDYHNVKRA